MLIAEGKCGANLFEARGALVFSQKLIFRVPLGTAGCADLHPSRGPGEERPPGLRVGHEGVGRKMSPARTFDQITKEPSYVASRGLYLVIFPKHAAILHSQTYL